MKHIILCGLLSLATAFGAHAQQSVPVYLDESKPVEERIEDALSRMTLQEKIRVIHAQSKFSRLEFPVLASPISGPMTVLTVSDPMFFGTNGTRPGRPTTPVWLFLHSPVWQPAGIPRCRASMAKLSERRLSIGERI